MHKSCRCRSDRITFRREAMLSNDSSRIGYFGLCYRNKKGHEWWLILEKPIRKQLDKHAASGPHNINLKFKIQFFVTDSCWIKLQDEVIRNLYYLQLRNEFTEGSLSCSKESAVLLASYGAQGNSSYCDCLLNIVVQECQGLKLKKLGGCTQ
ncbi:PREDICTED: tyrosine-protein phosphatase non-receptor type 21-like [Acropora digitifera]|uniref:tyrosine-protein phosphatase non-receptor type 21-like n=1 Tax=Acropora digitifera TaxID=70779 RepID=UPI00077AD794|nr:PREDICTED: tyrosine-protein phosphatase non-receptor type 21-like [Acropora digitifera]